MGVMHAVQPPDEAYVVFRIDAPRDLTRVDYGGASTTAPRDRASSFYIRLMKGKPGP